LYGVTLIMEINECNLVQIMYKCIAYVFTKTRPLGLYLYTLIIGIKTCKMFSILNELTLQRELQNVVTNMLSDKK